MLAHYCFCVKISSVNIFFMMVIDYDTKLIERLLHRQKMQVIYSKSNCFLEYENLSEKKIVSHACS